MIFPNALKSGVMPAPPCAPRKPKRNHVMTSSKISSAPQRSARSRNPSRKPGFGHHEPHVCRNRFDDDRREFVLDSVACEVDGAEVVIPRNGNIGAHAFGNSASACAARRGTRIEQCEIEVTVIVTRKLQHARAIRNARATRSALIIASVPLVTKRMRSIDGS